MRATMFAALITSPGASAANFAPVARVSRSNSAPRDVGRTVERLVAAGDDFRNLFVRLEAQRASLARSDARGPKPFDRIFFVSLVARLEQIDQAGWIYFSERVGHVALTGAMRDLVDRAIVRSAITRCARALEHD